MIRRVEAYEVWMPLREEFQTSFSTTRLRPAILVRVVDSSGEEGWGEIVAGEGPWYSYETIWTAWHVLEDYISKMIPEEPDPHKYNANVDRIRGHNMAKAGVEMAIWDLKARLESTPLWRMIGGARRHVKVGVSIGIKKTIQELLETIEYYLDQGYQRIKIKIKPGWDIKPVETIRREHPDTPLQVDANAAYTPRHIQTLRKLDQYNLLMIEQPYHYEDLAWHADLQAQLKTPICLDESITSPHKALAALRLNAAQIINIKPGRIGGIQASLQTHDTWSLWAGRPVWIGGMLETGIGRGHLVALATLPGVAYPSDISASNRYYEEDIVDKPWTLNKDSTITAPETPGIGVNIDWQKLEKYTKHKKTILKR